MLTMTASATDVKIRFGEYMDKAQREPVIVEKTGRSYAVLMGYDEYQRLMALEDALWAAKADQAKASDFIPREEVDTLLENI